MQFIIKLTLLAAGFFYVSACFDNNATGPATASNPPEASVMPDTSVFIGDTFKIYGAGLDEDGDIQAYGFRYAEDDEFTTIDESGIQVVAPTSPQILTIIFRVTDASGNHAYDTAQVSVIEQSETNDLSYFGLNGPIKKILLSSGPNKTLEYEYQFDIRGNLIHRISYFQDGSLLEKNTLAYDLNGNLIEETDFNASGMITRKVVNIYNDESQLIKSSHVTDSLYNEVTYDNNGYINSETIKHENGDLYGSTEYTNDDNGNKLELIEYDGDKNIIRTISNTYDAQGNLLETVEKDDSGFVVEKRQWTINSNGDVTKYLYFKSDSTAIIRQVLTYDDAANTVTIIFEQPLGSVQGREIYTYDEEDKLIRMQSFSSTDELLAEERYDERGSTTYSFEILAPSMIEYTETYVYTYDDYGNWIQRIAYEGETKDIVVDVQYQTITYY